MKGKLQRKKWLCLLLSILMVRLVCSVSVGAGENTASITECSDISTESSSEPESSEKEEEITSEPGRSGGETETAAAEPGNSGAETEVTATEPGNGAVETEGAAAEPDNSGVETETAATEFGNSADETEIMAETELDETVEVSQPAVLNDGEDEEGGSTPGSVSYVITIPDQVDFGTLTQPDTETDSYRFCELKVEASNLDLLTENQSVDVYISDSSATDSRFLLTQQVVSDPYTIPYDIYAQTVNAQTVNSAAKVNQSGNLFSQGYLLCSFQSGSAKAVQTAGLALNQKVLYGKNLRAIAGNYSGRVTFHCELTTNN